MIQEDNSASTSINPNDSTLSNSTTTEESNTLSQSINALKTFNPKVNYVVDSYVDAVDSYSTWRVAKIIQVKDDTAKVNYDGWSSRWDEIIKLGGSKMVPFRKITAPYTGGAKGAVRDFSFEDSKEYIAKTTEELASLTPQKLKTLEPNFINQFLRGKVYVLIDSVLSSPQPLKSMTDMKLVTDLMETFIEFFVGYLTLLPSLLKEYLDSRPLNQQLLYLVNEKVGLVSCIPEFCDTMTKLFGGYSRFKIYQNNDFALKNYNFQHAKLKEKYTSAYNQIINCINHFGSLGGFEKFIGLLKWELKTTTETKAKNEPVDKESVYRFPIHYIKWLLQFIQPTIQFFSSSYKDRFGSELKGAFFERVDRLTNRDLKDNENHVLSLIRESLPLFEDFMGRDAYVVCEQAELEVTLSILKSPFLERKIKAINEFKEFFDRADPQVDAKQLGDKRRFRYCTNDKLKNWIIQKKILEYVIGDQSHVEILKRSIPIMKFLANLNSLTQENLDILWKGYNSTHEEYVRAVYEAVIELSADISIENIDYLFTKIKEIPIENYNEPVIDLITKFSINGMKITSTSSPTSYFAKAIKRAPKYEYYGLKLLWEAIQDSSPLKEEYTQTAFISIVSLVKNSYFKSEKDKYLNACFENLKRGVSVPQSLLLSLHILSTYSNQSGLFGFNNSLDDIVTKLQKEYNLTESVVNDFERYMNNVAVVIKGLQEKGTVPTDKQSYCFVGKYSHLQNIEHRLTFIENIGISLKKGDFTIENMRNLWNILVVRAVTEVERNAFLKWLVKCKVNNTMKTKTYIIYDSLMKNFFHSVLCDPVQMENFKIMTPEIFSCFEKYFEIINEKEENIETEKIGFKVLKFSSLIGYDVLWKILLNCNNEKVIKEVQNLLVNVHLKISNNNVEDKPLIWQSFIERWTECLGNNYKNQDSELLTQLISLLNLFIVRFDGRKYIHKDGPVSETLNLVVADKRDERNRKTINVPINGTLFLLRKKIAEEFELQVFEFDMYLGPTSRISPSIEEDVAVTALANTDKEKDRDVLISLRTSVPVSVTQKEKFKNILINNQQIMDTLFDLLASENSKIVNDIWEILNSLPFNKSLRSTFEKLAVETEEEWFKILDFSCSRKLLYCLKIMEELAVRQTQEACEQWNRNFINKKGFDHLYKIYISIDNSELKSLFICKCAATLLRFINFFFEHFSTELSITSKQLSDAINKILMSLSLVTKNDFISDANDPHLQEDLQRPAQELTLASFNLLKTCIKRSPELISSIYEFPELSLLIRNGLIESNDIYLRTEFASGLITLVRMMNQVQTSQELQGANSFFLSFLLRDLLDYAFSHRDKCKEFFVVIEQIFNKCDDKDMEAAKIDFYDLANQLIQKIISLSPFEAQQSDQDYLLQGLMGLLKLVFTKKPSLKDDVILKAQPEFLNEILNNCLFEIPSDLVEKNIIPKPKCKSRQSRRLALQLLQSMAIGINEITILAVNYLKKPLLNNFWRTPSNADWFIVGITSERSETGYVGLENLGCTCYMNSLMQQLYMISDFRDTILETEDVNASQTEDHDNLFHQIQLIFGGLKISQRQYYDPRLFCYAFKDYEGNPINVLEQMDVDEFFSNIMDKLENFVKPTKNDGIIKRVFGGVLSNELICKGCPHYSEREEPCLAISLQVKNKKNIMESLQSFTQGEMLEGDNAYLCERCDKKVSTLKRVCIKKLPNILILVLKRFEFDFDTMQRSKVNDYCEFPSKLDMLPFTQGYLKKKESQKDEQSTNNDEMAANDAQEFPSEYYQYTLRGTVIHMGTADSGHYYSLIKDNTDAWYEFNDSIVKPFDIKDLPQEAFGGEEKLNIENIGNSKEVKERSRNAYLLFYEREAYFDDNTNKLQTMLVGEQDRETRSKIENISPKILEESKHENYKFHTTKSIWDEDYGDFVFRLLEQLSQKKDLADPTPAVFEAAKFCTLFFLTVVLRTNDRSKLPRFLRELKNVFKLCIKLCSWFVECFTYPDIVKEFLVDCPIKDMKYFVTGLLKVAIKNAYSESKELPYEEFEQSSICRLANALIYTFYEQKDQVKVLDKAFDLLALISSLGVNSKTYLIKKKMIGRIVYYMVPEQPPTETYKGYTEEFGVKNTVETSELGKPTITSGVKANELVKSVSEIINKKKEKMIMEATVTNYNALVETYSNLAASLKLNNADENNQSNLVNVNPEEDELEFLLSNWNVAKLILMNASTKRARKAASSLIAHLAYKNEEYSKEVFLLLEKELKEKDDIQLKVYLQSLEKLMLIQDGLQKMRVEKGITVLMGIIKDNSKFYRATEICLDYLFKLCSRNSWALRLCSENKGFLKFVEGWLREHSNPYHGFSSGTLKLFKKKSHKIIEQQLLHYQTRFTSKSQERLAKLKKINKNESEELAPEYDSDEDFSDHQYQIGEKIDFLIEGTGWTSSVVADNLDEMIKIVISSDHSQWIHYDSDRTGPHLKVQSHTKNNVNFYKT